MDVRAALAGAAVEIVERRTVGITGYERAQITARCGAISPDLGYPTSKETNS
ncbi:MAG: hypothetical protein LH603_11805 [Pseudonocardia sp.]|nr:hypothetical protein [Pseudonocardia sp.]